MLRPFGLWLFFALFAVPAFFADAQATSVDSKDFIQSLSSDEQTGGCTAFLRGYSSAAQEALLNPYAFAKDFRAYNFPDPAERVFLASLVMSASSVPAQYIPLFRIEDEKARLALFIQGLRSNPDGTMADIDAFDIKSRENARLLVAAILRFVIENTQDQMDQEEEALLPIKVHVPLSFLPRSHFFNRIKAGEILSSAEGPDFVYLVETGGQTKDLGSILQRKVALETAKTVLGLMEGESYRAGSAKLD